MRSMSETGSAPPLAATSRARMLSSPPPAGSGIVVRKVRSPARNVTRVVVDAPPAVASMSAVAPCAKSSGRPACACSSPATQSERLAPALTTALIRNRVSGRTRPSRSMAALIARVASGTGASAALRAAVTSASVAAR